MSKTKSDANCHSNDSRKSHHPEKIKKNLVARLNRIEGQVRSVKRLITEDTYCDDVLNLISSIQAALGGVGNLLLEHHMKSCIVDQIKDGDIYVVDELMSTIRKLTK